MMNEIELSGNRYSIGKLSAKQQFHLSRRIAPIIPPLIPVYQRLARSGASLAEDGQALSDDGSALSEVLQPFMDGIAAISDADGDQIIDLCLSVVQRRQESGWANVWNPQHGVCLFQDMDLGVVLPLVLRVITHNLGPFMAGLLTSQGSGPETTGA
ncbi:hypothetical protein CEG14_15575 [Bordetella genomosp. 1]|uniref:Bacteriophage protein n=2 Tax=Bordetella genomosp. 1 TaxID=1395607 RepID=A0A261SH69_9BORD|nr:hypothetical protein CEG14_15575 [Bordetella genomosp. 1]